MRVIAVGAHPDDIEIGCGGSLARHRAAGDDVRVLIMTAGCRRGDSTVRMDEATAAARTLGCQLRWGQGEDGSLTTAEVNEFVEDQIGSFAPDVVYTHCTRDSHADHRATAQGVLAAARTVPTVLHYESPSTLTFVPVLFSDIADTLPTKLAALACHDSQLGAGSRADSEAVRAKALAYGFDARLRAAEAFEVTRALWNPTEPRQQPIVPPADGRGHGRPKPRCTVGVRS